jgi:hypothetical protein
MGMQSWVGFVFFFQMCECDPNGFQLPLLYETQVFDQQLFKRKKMVFLHYYKLPSNGF